MNKRRDTIFISVIFVAILALIFLPTGYENPDVTRDFIYEKAQVIEVDNSSLSNISVVTLGSQRVRMVIERGEFKGDTLWASNAVVGQKNIDKIFKPKDKVLLIARVDRIEGRILDARADDYFRQDLELLLVAAFVLCLVLVARKTGLKAALSFVFTALVFWKLLIPAFLSGFSPLLVAFGVVFLCTSVIILLVGGITRKGLVALSGSMLGVFLTALLALLFGHFFKIPGTIQEYSEALLYSGFIDLDFSQMFISCIFISSAGAVMDVAMDIAASQDELQEQAPHLSRQQLIRSGLNIAAPVIGSMTTTLLFAYSGSFMFAFMAFMAKGMPIEAIVNRGFIAAEILHTMVGSFGLVLVAPVTAFIGGYVYKIIVVR